MAEAASPGDKGVEVRKSEAHLWHSADEGVSGGETQARINPACGVRGNTPSIPGWYRHRDCPPLRPPGRPCSDQPFHVATGKGP